MSFLWDRQTAHQYFDPCGSICVHVREKRSSNAHFCSVFLFSFCLFICSCNRLGDKEWLVLGEREMRLVYEFGANDCPQSAWISPCLCLVCGDCNREVNGCSNRGELVLCGAWIRMPVIFNPPPKSVIFQSFQQNSTYRWFNAGHSW